MKKLLLPLISIILAACSAIAPAPTATAILTFTTLPTETPIPTNTLEPTLTLAPPSETPDALSGLRPQGTPVAEWKGIPIMPGAIAGGGDEDSYTFTINATVEEVQSYYETELSKLGWILMSSGSGGTGAVMLIFNIGKPPLMPISIIPDGDLMLVLIVNSQ